MANQAIVITEKANGNVTQQQANDVIALQSPSAVKISVGPEEIASFNQSGMNLVIVLKSGEQIVIADFFVVTDDVRSELILEDSNGVLWLGQYQSPWSHFAFAEINEEGLVAAGDVSPWVFALGGLGVLGAAIAASDSSSSDSNPPDNEEPGAGDGIDDGDEPDAGDPMDPDDGDADADADGDADADADADGDADGDADADADGDADGDADADADADGDADADADADGDADADADADADGDADADADGDADADADADGDADADADGDADGDADADADADGDADADADGDADADADADADGDADGDADADADADGDADGDADADADADGDVTAPIAPALALANDTGADDNDGITSDGTVNVGNLEPDATWEYSLDGGDTWIEGVGESFELPDGTYADGDVIARQTDAAGNTSDLGSLGAVIIDSAAPDAPVIDTVTDVIGDNGEPTGTTVVGTAEPGSTVEVRDADGEVVGSGLTDENGDYTLTTDTPLVEGDAYDVVAIDAAGNESDPSLLIGTIIAPATPSLVLDNDTGADDNDGITSDGTVNVGNLEPDATWEYSLDGGDTWIEGVGESFELPDGDYAAGDVIARQTDAAGNTSGNGSLGAVIIDSAAPEAPTLVLDNDTGADDNDGITSDGTVNVGNLEPDATWEYSLDGGDTWIEGVGESFELPDGDYADGDVIARQTDAAGNTSDLGSLGAVIIDSAAPDAPVIDTVTDVIGDNGEPTGTTVVGTAEPGSTIEVRDADGEVVGSGLTDENGDYTLTTDTPLVEGDAYDVVAIDAAGNESDPSLLIGNAIAPATPSLTLDNDTGADDNDGITSDGTVNVGNLEPDATWEYSLDGGDTWVEGVGESFELPDGDYTAGDVIARQTDAAGNTSGNGSLGAVIIDSAAPEAPTLVLDNDTGADDSDGITSDGTVNVGNLEPDATWEYSLDGGDTWVEGVGESFELPDGDYTAGDVIARQTDAAGNTSGNGSLGAVIIDSAAPEAPTLVLDNDTGADDSDGITSDGTVNVGNLEPDATWEYSLDGGDTWVEGVGESFGLPDGDYAAGDVIARQTDAAGNTSDLGSLGAVIIDSDLDGGDGLLDPSQVLLGALLPGLEGLLNLDEGVLSDLVIDTDALTSSLNDALGPLLGFEFDPDDPNGLDEFDNLFAGATDSLGNVLGPLIGEALTQDVLDALDLQVDFITDGVITLLQDGLLGGLLVGLGLGTTLENLLGESGQLDSLLETILGDGSLIGGTLAEQGLIGGLLAENGTIGNLLVENGLVGLLLADDGLVGGLLADGSDLNNLLSALLNDQGILDGLLSGLFGSEGGVLGGLLKNGAMEGLLDEAGLLTALVGSQGVLGGVIDELETSLTDLTESLGLNLGQLLDDELFPDLLNEGGGVDQLLGSLVGAEGVLTQLLGTEGAGGQLADKLLGAEGPLGSLLESLVGEGGLLTNLIGDLSLNDSQVNGLLEGLLGEEGLLANLLGTDGPLGGVLEDTDLLNGLLDEEGLLAGLVNSLLGNGGLLEGLIGEEGLVGESGFVNNLLDTILGPNGLLAGLSLTAVVDLELQTDLLANLLGPDGLLAGLLGANSPLGNLLGEEEALGALLGNDGIVGNLLETLLGEEGVLSGLLEGDPEGSELLSTLLQPLLGEQGLLADLLGNEALEGDLLNDLLDGLLGQGGLLSGLIGTGGVLEGLLGEGDEGLLDGLLGNDGVVANLLDTVVSENGLLGNLTEGDLLGGEGGLLGEQGLVGSLLDTVAGPNGLLSGLLTTTPVDGEQVTGLLDGLLGENGLVAGLLGGQGLEDSQLLDGLLGNDGLVNGLVGTLVGGGLLGDLTSEDLLGGADGLLGEEGLVGNLLDTLVGPTGLISGLLIDVSVDAELQTNLVNNLLSSDGMLAGLLGDGGPLGGQLNEGELLEGLLGESGVVANLLGTLVGGEGILSDSELGSEGQVSNLLDTLLGQNGLLSSLPGSIPDNEGLLTGLVNGLLGESGLLAGLVNSGVALSDPVEGGTEGLLDSLLGENGLVTETLNTLLGDDGLLGGLVDSTDQENWLGNDGLLSSVLSPIVGPGGLLTSILASTDATLTPEQGEGLLADLIGTDGLLEGLLQSGGALGDMDDQILVDGLTGDGGLVNGIVGTLLEEDGVLNGVVDESTVGNLVEGLLGENGLIGSLGLSGLLGGIGDLIGSIGGGLFGGLSLTSIASDDDPVSLASFSIEGDESFSIAGFDLDNVADESEGVESVFDANTIGDLLQEPNEDLFSDTDFDILIEEVALENNGETIYAINSDSEETLVEPVEVVDNFSDTSALEVSRLNSELEQNQVL